MQWPAGTNDAPLGILRAQLGPPADFGAWLSCNTKERWVGVVLERLRCQEALRNICNRAQCTSHGN